MGIMTSARNIKRFVNGRKCFIEVVSGPAIRGEIFFDDNTAAYPLESLGNGTAIEFGLTFLRRLGIPTDDAFVMEAHRQGEQFHHLTAIVHAALRDDELELAATGASHRIDRIRRLLSFYTAGDHRPLIRFRWDKESSGAVEFVGPAYRGLASRNSLDPICEDFLRSCATDHYDDERLHYFMETLEQAYALEDYYFRIARLFSILEAMAGPIRSQFEQQGAQSITRTAIRFMVGYFVEFDIPKFTIMPDRVYEFDHIELAGRLRDKIFHGGDHLVVADVPQNLRRGVELLGSRPDMIAHQLRKDSELELSRWVNHQSRSWLANNGTKFPLPTRKPNYDGTVLMKFLISSNPAPRSPIASIAIQVAGRDAGLVKLELRI